MPFSSAQREPTREYLAFTRTFFSKLIPGIYWALSTSDFIAGSAIRHSGAKGGPDGPEVAS
jgi:hypothetical protein